MIANWRSRKRTAFGELRSHTMTSHIDKSRGRPQPCPTSKSLRRLIAMSLRTKAGDDRTRWTRRVKVRALSACSPRLNSGSGPPHRWKQRLPHAAAIGSEPERAYMVRTDLLNALKAPQQEWRGDTKLVTYLQKARHHPTADIHPIDGQIEVALALLVPVEPDETAPDPGREKSASMSSSLRCSISTSPPALFPISQPTSTQPPTAPPDPDQLKIIIAANGLLQPWEITLKNPPLPRPPSPPHSAVIGALTSPSRPKPFRPRF